MNGMSPAPESRRKRNWRFATNIGKAVSKGIEFEITANPARGLVIGLNGSLNNAKVKELAPEESAISGAFEGTLL